MNLNCLKKAVTRVGIYAKKINNLKNLKNEHQPKRQKKLPPLKRGAEKSAIHCNT